MMRDYKEIFFVMGELLKQASKNETELDKGNRDTSDQWIKLIHQRELLGKVDALQWVLKMRDDLK